MAFVSWNIPDDCQQSSIIPRFEPSRLPSAHGRPRKNKWCPEEKPVILSNNLEHLANIDQIFAVCPGF
jgi:hypothetical protein